MTANNSTSGNYEAMARRYRPKAFADVVGQEHVARTLQNAITAGRVAHAYLFCGAHGCGKTTMARIFASALVCEKGPTASPCGECALCLDVMHGYNADVQEIDGASNNGVEQVRSLREQAAYVPTRARYKIYIIDEVHMLSLAAFNALLKTLEEPPAHVKFILATTDPHKIPGTILSRCQRFDFRLVPSGKLSAFLKTLVAKENAEITDDAVAAVAAFSGGSVRDSLVLLDQLLSYCGGKVTREDVENVRGVAGAEIVAGLFETVCAKDLPGALQILDAVAARGTNCGDFLDQLIEYGRDLMQVIATGRLEQVTAYGPALNTLKNLANSLKLDQALLMLEVFSEARVRVRSRALSNPLVALEMAVARLAGLDNLEPLAELIRKLDGYAHGAKPQVALPSAEHPKPENRPAAPASRPAPVPPRTAAPAADKTADEKHSGDAAGGNGSKADPAAPENTAAESVSAAPVPASDPVVHPAIQTQAAALKTAPASVKLANPAAVRTTISVNAAEEEEESGEDENNIQAPSPAPLDNAALWTKIFAEISERSAPDRGFLADVFIDHLDGSDLYLSLPGGGAFIFEQLEDPIRKKRLAEAAGAVLGRPVRIFYKVRDAIITAAPANGLRERRREVEMNPQVQMVLRSFNGTIQDIILGDER